MDMAGDEILRQSGEDRFVIIKSGNGQILFRQQNNRGHEYSPDCEQQDQLMAPRERLCAGAFRSSRHHLRAAPR